MIRNLLKEISVIFYNFYINKLHHKFTQKNTMNTTFFNVTWSKVGIQL